jgi:iron-sulfur cluster repair protein YtfE (RIC family)
MNPKTARMLLMGQHDAIRASLAECVGIAKRLRAGDGLESELETALERMRAELYQHNLCETSLLRPLLMRTHRWGEVLLERMIEEHVAEHVAMWSVMNQPAMRIAHQLDDLADELDAHMASEERTFLAVLRPDVLEHHRG